MVGVEGLTRAPQRLRYHRSPRPMWCCRPLPPCGVVLAQFGVSGIRGAHHAKVELFPKPVRHNLMVSIPEWPPRHERAAARLRPTPASGGISAPPTAVYRKPAASPSTFARRGARTHRPGSPGARWPGPVPGVCVRCQQLCRGRRVRRPTQGSARAPTRPCLRR